MSLFAFKTFFVYFNQPNHVKQIKFTLEFKADVWNRGYLRPRKNFVHRPSFK